MHPCAGVILCGGRSSRMGRPKEWLNLGGKPLLQHVASAMADAVAPLIVVAAPDQSLPNLAVPCEVRIVGDEQQHQGPLHGIMRGLESLPGECDAAYVTSCDVPLLKPAWIRAMVGRLGEADVAIAVHQTRHQPLAAVYRRHLASAARDLLAADRRRPVFLLEKHSVVEVNAEDLLAVDPNLDSLVNANTPEEFADLQRRFDTMHNPP